MKKKDAPKSKKVEFSFKNPADTPEPLNLDQIHQQMESYY